MTIDPSLSEEERQKEINAKLHILSSEQEERVTKYRADKLNMPYISLAIFPMDPDILELIPKSQAQKIGAVLFHRQGNDLRLGVLDPKSDEVKKIVKQIEDKFGHPPTIYMISAKSLQVALSRYRREKTLERAPQDELSITEEESNAFKNTLDSLRDLGQRISSLSPTEILDAIAMGAVAMEASDIHVEPKENNARLRFRIDGVLHDITDFDRQGWALILSRIKVLSKLKLNVRDVPQDGSFVLRLGEDTYDMRVSVLPGGYGENIVIRLLNRKSEVQKMEDLGMKERDYTVVLDELKRPNGLILVTGPTGSGKTTTLASFIREVNRPESKIITLEDPIEYRLPGIEQTQVDVDAGYTFAKGLRSILRQDPDVILIGEMRDTETVETAVHASLTGHLVFSTLHTNNAAGAVPRLVDMGIKPFVLAPALNMVIAQRLVRVVCTKCAQEYSPDSTLREHIAEVMRGIRSDVFSPKVLKDKNLKFLKAKGCDACGGTGYKGRKGVFEIFVADENMKNMVLKGTDSQTIQEEALKQGMTTISQDAFLKVIEHITTIEEVERISEE